MKVIICPWCRKEYPYGEKVCEGACWCGALFQVVTVSPDVGLKAYWFKVIREFTDVIDRGDKE